MRRSTSSAAGVFTKRTIERMSTMLDVSIVRSFLESLMCFVVATLNLRGVRWNE
jgi:hypothetical protein